MAQGLVLLAGMGWLLAGALRKKGKTLKAFVPFILLALGLAEMVLKDLAVLPAPHAISTVIAVVCLLLSLVTLALYWGLRMRETGRRGRS
jgi:hypothetical protein